MARVLLLAATTGYQTRSFGEAAERLGVELVFATDRCHMLDDPWVDGAIAVRFHEPRTSAAAIVSAARARPLAGILAVGDRPTVIAAEAAAALGIRWHSREGTVVARDKRRTRERLRAGGLPTPWFRTFPLAADPSVIARELAFPCVVKPLGLSGSRGVMRADGPNGFVAAFERLKRLLLSPEVRAERTRLHDAILVEGFIEGAELALEGILDDGTLHTLALFDKPDPLDGPFFEETIYVTPSRVDEPTQRAIAAAIGDAASLIGLRHGPIHAECRVNAAGVFVLEIAARPIGGLCARAVQLETDAGDRFPLEEALLRHALGESPRAWRRERRASGVMMIPIPSRGIYRGVAGVDRARGVPGIDEVRITARPDQLLVPLPEGASYLGFMFAHADCAADAERALRDAHARLAFAIDPELRVVQSAHG